MATGRIPGTAGSPLTAKGDLFGYSTTAARVPVGSDGSILVADSSQTTGLRYNPIPDLANPIINGGFDIWQRGTSISIAASTTYTSGYSADRWDTTTGTNQAITISRQATGDTTNLPNIQYCARYQRNSGQTGTGNLLFAQSLETSNSIPFIGKTVTVSFYARKGSNYSASSSNLTSSIATGTGTDQNALGGYTGGADNFATHTLTTTWQRFVNVATLSATGNEIVVYFQFTPTGTAGAADYYEVTGVQIDLGTYTAATAPAFRRSGNTIQGELAACQRYYYRVSNGASYTKICDGAYYNTTLFYGNIYYPVSMRTLPSINLSGGVANSSVYAGNNGGTAGTAYSANTPSYTFTELKITTAAQTAGWGGTFYANPNYYYEASAEL